MEEKFLVEIFCEVQMDGLNKAVGETFTKLAFEAVEKIINVSVLKEKNKMGLVSVIKCSTALKAVVDECKFSRYISNY